MTPKLLFAIAVVALSLVALHTALSIGEAYVRIINQTQSTSVIVQVDDAFYSSSPGGSDQWASGQLSHHVSVLTERCAELASFDLAAGENALVK